MMKTLKTVWKQLGPSAKPPIDTQQVYGYLPVEHREESCLQAADSEDVPMVEFSLSTHEYSMSERIGIKDRWTWLEKANRESIARIPVATIRFLLPSFLSQLWSDSSPGNTQENRSKITSTTYLNGIRGLAAIFVFQAHFFCAYYPSMNHGYLSSPTDSRFLQMPILRLVHSGRFMVAIFLVLSGFVLSYKPLRLLRKRDPSLIDCIASSIFRRAPRLFLPCAAPMLIASFCVDRGWYGVPASNVTGPKYVRSYPERAFEEWRWFMGLVNPFSWDDQFQPPHMPQLWTLPLEFRGSMVVFISILTLYTAKAKIRMPLLAAFCYYSISVLRWDIFLFICGTLLAETHLIKKEASFELEDLLKLIYIRSNKAATPIRIISYIFWILVLMSGLFLGSWPIFSAETTPGYITLTSLAPNQYATPDQHLWFWCSIAAVMVLMALENLPFLQRPFAASFSRYIGDISFAFYIVHWTVAWTIGRYLTNEAIGWLGDYNWGFAIGWVITMPMTIWVADVHWRICDDTCVRFSRWLWAKCTEG